MAMTARRRSGSRHGIFLGSGLAFLFLAGTAGAADWPQYRHDAGRTAYTPDALAPSLHVQWVFTPPHPPLPAWPEPVREYNLMDFDYAFQPVVAGGRVFFGSSADHHIYALDAKSAKVLWTFCTQGPIRFAPAVWQDRVLAASDDGHIYCLSAKDGSLAWKKRLGPTDELIIGNGRIASRWLLRSGLAVSNGLVYATAGMWPLEKTFVGALKIEDGAEAWKTEPPDFAPQGYLALNSKFLYLPAGRAPMWVMGIDGGGAHAIHPAGRSAPMAREDLVLTGPQTHGANENLPSAGGPAFGPRAASIFAWTPAMDRILKPAFGDRNICAFGTNACYLAGGGKLNAYDLALNGKWEVEGPARSFAMLVAGQTIVVGGEKTVRLYSTDGGKDLGSIPVSGQARGLAAADGNLFVSLETGEIVCLGPEEPAHPAKAAAAPAQPSASRSASQKVAAILKENPGLGKGFGLLIGADADTAAELARQTALQVYCVEADEARVRAARKALAGTGLYGSRVTVLHVADRKLPLPDYFANLVLAPDASAVLPAELDRVLRPCGGVAYRDGKRTVREPLEGATDWTHEYATPGNTSASGDTRVTWPLRMLWFGEPGPNVAMNRHLRGSAPVTSNGRMFILGQHSLNAVDAYNGAKLWSVALPSAQRRVTDILGGCMASDPDSVYLATAGVCIRFSADAGSSAAVYRVPVSRAALSLQQPQKIAVGEGNEIEMKSTPEGLELVLTTKDAKVASADPEKDPGHGDSWELFFDFRPEKQRDVTYAPGVCHAFVVPAGPEKPSPSWKPGPWAQPFALAVEGAPVADGSRTLVRLAWAEAEKLAGAKPASFGFGAILNSSDDGKTLTRRTCRFATRSSYRLADLLCTVSLGPVAAAPTASPLDAIGAPEDMLWGHLAVVGETIVGSLIEQVDTPDTLRFGWDFGSEGKDFTGPSVVQVLDSVGAASGTRCVFAVNKGDGTVRWQYRAEALIPHTAICVHDGRVYLLDRPPLNQTEAEKRRGQPPSGTAALVVLDLESGKKLASLTEGLSDYGNLRAGHGVLLASSMTGMTAFDAKELKTLWSVVTPQPMHHCSAFLRVPTITKTWVYDEPFAYDLRTGKQRPMDATKPDPWTWGNFRGCGTVSGSDSLLFFRSGTPSILDALGTPVLHSLTGIRPGCYINMIAACGLALMPEASSGCGCPYNFQTTVALAPAK